MTLKELIASQRNQYLIRQDFVKKQQAVIKELLARIEVLEEQWNISLSVLELYMRTQDHEHAQDGKCLD